MNSKPFVSVIVCTFNGANKISDCLNSLICQDYDKNKYKIIVVNDGSTDNTLSVISRYTNIEIVNHDKNRGIGAARNSGLNFSVGELVAYTDDDCEADVYWLKNLTKHYKNDVMAVGGITNSYSLNTLMEKYMAEAGYGNPAPIEFAESKNPFYRFFIYLKDMSSSLIVSSNDPMEVHSIYTLNASFRRDILIEAGGWSTGLNSSEDSEMCDRINRLFPSKKILFTRKAIITHKHRTSFWKFLKQTYVRGEDTLKCYIEDKKFPPIFPFPIMWLIFSFLGLLAYPVIGILLFFFLPQLLYFWWLVKLFNNWDYSYFLFPYMQLSLELATVIGMIKGFLSKKG